MLEKLKGARRIEVFLVLAALAACVLLLGRGAQTAQDTLEARMAAVFSQIEGAGRVSVILSRGEAVSGSEGAVTGAVIVAQGASRAGVLLELQRAAQALLGLELDSIEVLRMEDAS